MRRFGKLAQRGGHTPSRRLTTVAAVGTAAIGYAIGSIPVANTIARQRGAADLRTVGDGNPGYWNAKDAIGARDAQAVFVGDVAKGIAAAAAGRMIGAIAARPPSAGRRPAPTWWYPYLGGGAAMVGHAFPAGSGFRGGKGVLTFVGTMIVAAPLPAALSLTLTGVTWAASGRFDRAAQLGVVSFPFVQLATEGRYRTAASGVLMTFIGLRFATTGQPDNVPNNDPAGQASVDLPRQR